MANNNFLGNTGGQEKRGEGMGLFQSSFVFIYALSVSFDFFQWMDHCGNQKYICMYMNIDI